MADPPPAVVSSIEIRRPPAFKTSDRVGQRLLWPANHSMVRGLTGLSRSSTFFDPAPTARIVGVSSNEPVDGADDGNASPDWEITGPLTVNLRAERSGVGTGRVYTIQVEGSDAAGERHAADALITYLALITYRDRPLQLCRVLTSKRQSLDTAGSALTGRHPPSSTATSTWRTSCSSAARTSTATGTRMSRRASCTTWSSCRTATSR